MPHLQARVRNYYNGQARSRMGASAATVTRTLLYMDLRGAPWVLTASGPVGEADNDVTGTSVAYKSSSTHATSLPNELAAIDEKVKDLSRTPFEESAQRYPQPGFKDSIEDDWSVEFVSNSTMPGYYALQFGTTVGPAPNKTDLKKMVEAYLKRLEGEKSVTSKYGAASESFVTETHDNIPLDVPPEARASQAPAWKKPALLAAGLAGASYVVYRIWKFVTEYRVTY